MGTLSNIMLEGNHTFYGKNYSSWKHHMLTIFYYMCLDQCVLSKKTRPTTARNDQTEFDKNRGVLIMIKL